MHEQRVALSLMVGGFVSQPVRRGKSLAFAGDYGRSYQYELDRCFSLVYVVGCGASRYFLPSLLSG